MSTEKQVSFMLFVALFFITPYYAFMDKMLVLDAGFWMPRFQRDFRFATTGFGCWILVAGCELRDSDY